MTLSELINARISHTNWPRGMPYGYLTALYSRGLEKAADVFKGKEISSQQGLDELADQLAQVCGPLMRIAPQPTTCQIVAFALYLTLNRKTFS